MDLRMKNRALLRGMLASALAIAGASACSRSDRTETGRDNTATVLPDTLKAATTQPANEVAADTAVSSSEQGVSGYRAMEQDTGADSSAAGYTEMARDTSTTPDQVNSDVEAQGDVTVLEGRR